MTIKELYDWAVENEIEDYELKNIFYNDKEESYQTYWFTVDDEAGIIFTDFEC